MSKQARGKKYRPDKFRKRMRFSFFSEKKPFGNILTSQTRPTEQRRNMNLIGRRPYRTAINGMPTRRDREFSAVLCF